jgi:hypothetical protein
MANSGMWLNSTIGVSELRPAAVAGDGVVLTRHGEHAVGVETGHHLLDLVELRRGRMVVVDDVADHLAAGDAEDHRGAEPACVTQQLTPRHAVLGGRVTVAHRVTVTVAVMNGWIMQK